MNTIEDIVKYIKENIDEKSNIVFGIGRGENGITIFSYEEKEIKEQNNEKDD